MTSHTPKALSTFLYKQVQTCSFVFDILLGNKRKGMLLPLYYMFLGKDCNTLLVGTGWNRIRVKQYLFLPKNPTNHNVTPLNLSANHNAAGGQGAV
jgi:hypothetical protein